MKKWEQSFKKDNITRNIETTSGKVKTFVATMEKTITQKNTLERMGLEFMRIIWPKIGPTSTPKGFKK